MISKVVGSLKAVPREFPEVVSRSEGRSVSEHNPPLRRLRILYSKEGPARFQGHLDFVKHLERAVRLAEFPVAWSRGFHPHLRVSLGAPLPQGYSSRAELLDLYLLQGANPERLFRYFPEGYSLEDWWYVALHGEAPSAAPREETWRLSWMDEKQRYRQAALLEEALASGEILHRRMRKGRERVMNFRPLIKRLRIAEDGLILTGQVREGRRLRPDQLLEAVTGDRWQGDPEITKISVSFAGNKLFEVGK
jgi:radical SAM-linked protein